MNLGHTVFAQLYQQHNVREWLDWQRDSSEQPIPNIVCSEALT
jgi:hypothetical protein